jgi:tetratricopeptide (TPR) repeat protein
MPPWLPEPGYGEFAGERRLSEDRIKTIQSWVEQGAAEGAPSDLPLAPKFKEGWQLGQPDLIVKMPRPYVLPAEGGDVFRNFVIPVPVETTRFVKAVEILPGNKKIVHHANVLIDRTQSFRRVDEKDAEAGFEGMDITIESERFEPDSHFLFWKPGTPPAAEPDGMAWRLDKGTDLILNMHMVPSGKPETIQASLGLYFTDKAPSRHPMLLQLEHDGAIDIEPGRKDFIITDEFELPVDVDVLGVYPHAHYLGKEIQGFATLPGGTRKWLIRIRNWDLNWQAVYKYVKPIFLPKGTVLSMRYTYDNSAGNVRNPNNPPKRVVAGDRSSDEMGHFWVQVLPRAGTDARLLLHQSLMQQRLRKYPGDFTAHFNLGSVLQAQGKTGEAIRHFMLAVKARPDSAAARNNLGAALRSQGSMEDAVAQFRAALQASPDYANARYNLASSLLAQGRTGEAVTEFFELLRVQPEDAQARNDLGGALAVQGDLRGAAAQLEQALHIDPQHAGAHYNLGRVRALQGDLEKAAQHFEQALRINPQDADAYNDLGKIDAMQGNLARAVAHFEKALRIDPKHPEAGENLKRARAQIPQHK